MCVLSVAAVVVARVLGVQALESRREAGVGDPHERVAMAAHQDVREQGELEVLPGGGQAIQEVLAILIVHKQITRVAAPSCKVVDAFVETA